MLFESKNAFRVPARPVWMVDAENVHLAALQVHRQNKLAVRAETRLLHMLGHASTLGKKRRMKNEKKDEKTMNNEARRTIKTVELRDPMADYRPKG
jgi:hypothetical protein